MMDRTHRPPPLELAPPKRTNTVAVALGRTSTKDGASIRKGQCAVKTFTRPQKTRSAATTATRRQGLNPMYLSWIQLFSDAVQIHICAVLVAGLGTFLYQIPSALGTPTGSTAIAALTLLTLSISLSFLSMFRPHSPPSPWALLVRLVLAFSFVAIFLAWIAQVPGPRVFEPRGYRLWDMPPETGNGLVAGVTFVLGVAEFARAVVWRHTLLGEVGRWRHGSDRRRGHHARQRRRAAERPSRGDTLEEGTWPLKDATTTTVTPA